MEKEMIYEITIRKANGNCNRYGVAGADADIYRHLQNVFAIGPDGKDHSTDWDKSKALHRVNAFLADALERMIEQPGLYDNAKGELQAIRDSLVEVSYETIESALDRLLEIYINAN